MKEPPDTLRTIRRELHHLGSEGARIIRTTFRVQSHHRPTLIISVERHVLVLRPISHSLRVLIVKKHCVVMYIAETSSDRAPREIAMSHQGSRTQVPVRLGVICSSPISCLPGIGLRIPYFKPLSIRPGFVRCEDDPTPTLVRTRVIRIKPRIIPYVLQHLIA